MSNPMRYEIRNEQVEKKLHELASQLKSGLPEGYGFMLLIFGFTPNDEMFYISSAKRESMIAAMREFVQKFEEN